MAKFGTDGNFRKGMINTRGWAPSHRHVMVGVRVHNGSRCHFKLNSPLRDDGRCDVDQVLTCIEAVENAVAYNDDTNISPEVKKSEVKSTYRRFCGLELESVLDLMM